MTRLSAKSLALADQIAAVLRDEQPVPLSTGEVGRHMGMKLVHMPSRLSAIQRPACWPDEVTGPDWTSGSSPCDQCGVWHAPPVWRVMGHEDVRPALNRLEKAGRVRRVMVDGYRSIYWQWAGDGVSDESGCE